MSDLLNLRINSRLDKSDMKSAISSFHGQISQSFEIMRTWSPIKKYSGIQNIMILGMGGSAIGGDVARVIAQNHALVPIIVNRSYSIPKFLNSFIKSLTKIGKFFASL